MKSAIVLMFLASTGVVFADKEEPRAIRIVCEYTYSLIADGTTGKTSGQDLFTIEYDATGRAVIKKAGLGATFSGVITEETIYAEAEYLLGAILVSEVLRVNRYTGEMTLSISSGSGPGLVNFGSCNAAPEKLF